MSGRLDRYVGKTVLASYTATLLFVVFLFVIVTLLLNVGDYLEVAQEKGIGLFSFLGLWMQLNFISIPWIFVGVAPFVTVIGGMFAVSRLMAANEITPMVFTGRSMLRVLSPAIAMALLSAGTMAFAWEFVLPSVSQTMTRLTQVLEKPDEDSSGLESIVLFSPDRRSRLMCDRYDPELQRMEGVVVIDTGSQVEDLAETKATVATWHPERNDWELVGGKLLSGAHAQERKWLSMDGVTPEIVRLSGIDKRGSFMLAYSEILSLIGLSPGRPDLVIALHYHLTWPLANVLLLILALPFAVQFERGSRIGRILLAIMICGGYLMVDLTCQNLGRNEWLHPVLATWTPTILFGSLGVVMFGGMRT